MMKKLRGSRRTLTKVAAGGALAILPIAAVAGTATAATPSHNQPNQNQQNGQDHNNGRNDNSGQNNNRPGGQNNFRPQPPTSVPTQQAPMITLPTQTGDTNPLSALSGLFGSS